VWSSELCIHIIFIFGLELTFTLKMETLCSYGKVSHARLYGVIPQKFEITLQLFIM
jgi:hypothetical protein